MGVIFEEVTAELDERPATDEVEPEARPGDADGGREALLRSRRWQAEWARYRRRQARLEAD